MDQIIHRGRNQIYSFHCLLGRPQRPQGCQKMRHYPLNLDLEVWCSNIEPKLNEHQKTSRSHQKRLIFGRISQFLQFWLHIRAPNLQRGNILPHVQYHCLVRPSFPTCAVPPIIFELSVPIFRHVQYHPNISEL